MNSISNPSSKQCIDSDFEVVPIPVYYLFHNEFSNDQYKLFMYLFQNKIIWFSYRKNFQPIVKPAKQINVNPTILDLLSKSSVYTSDVGWGCMLRCSQMLLSQALIKQNNFASKNEIIKLFLDNQRFPFSIHTMISEGNKFGKNPGDWYGPHMACHVIKNCYDNSKETDLKVIIAEQGTLYEDEYQKENNEKLVLIPVRLGVRKIEPRYYSDIRYFLKHHGSIGMLGGTPRHALYFVGSVKTQEGKETNKLIAMDPHTVQDTDFEQLTTYKCNDPKLIHMNEIDPSIAIGFYFRNPDDFKSLKTMIDCNNSDLITIKKTRNSEMTTDNIIEEFELIGS